MSLFLKPVAETLTTLHTVGKLVCVHTRKCQSVLCVYLHGVVVSPPGTEPFTCHAVLLACTCDYPARTQVMNMIQFNGFYGCSHCQQKGTGSLIGMLIV